ncbi:MAG: hypothetical protein CMI09_16245 [Oceanospirillaceae bacterium]|nr:hypothetical protein [Oceanospirillaceae bacterium]
MTFWRSYQFFVFTLPLAFGANTEWAWNLYSAFAMFFFALSAKHSALCKHFPAQQQKANWVLAILLIIQAWGLFQWLFGFTLTPYDTLMTFLKGLGYASFFGWTLLAIDSPQKVVRIVWIVVLAAAFQAAYGSLMVMTGLEYGFFLEKWTYLSYATGTFVNRNHLAGYLEIATALGVGLLLAQTTQYSGSWRKRLRQFITMLLSEKVVLRVLLAIMVIGLVMTRSRMGNTAFFASLSVAGLLALFLFKNKTRSTTILLSSLLIIDIAIVGTFFGVDKVAERLQKTSEHSEKRDEVFRDTLTMWKSAPITGTGAGSFIYTFPKFKSDDILDPHYVNNAHNDYLQFLAEFGAPATALLGSTVLFSLWTAIQAMRKRRSELHKGMGFASTMGMIAIGIHSTVDFNLQIPANAYMFVFLMALAFIARWGPSEDPSDQRRRRRNRAAPE